MKTLALLFLSACFAGPAAIPLTEALPASTSPEIDGAQTSEASAKIELLDRVVVIGASLSAGWGLESESRSKISFADIFDATIKREHGRVGNQTHPALALDPAGYGRLIVDATKALKPTLIIAVDYPFWFGYGNVSDERRLSRLQAGLAMLDEFKCPVLIGDFPNMSHATDTGVLGKSQVPSEAKLRELNTVILDWILKRPNRYRIKLAELVESVQASKEIPIGTGWKRSRMHELTQADKLHPTLLGSSMVAVMTAELLLEAFEELPRDSFDLDTESIAKRVQSAK